VTGRTLAVVGARIEIDPDAEFSRETRLEPYYIQQDTFLSHENNICVRPSCTLVA